MIYLYESFVLKHYNIETYAPNFPNQGDFQSVSSSNQGFVSIFLEAFNQASKTAVFGKLGRNRVTFLPFQYKIFVMSYAAFYIIWTSEFAPVDPILAKNSYNIMYLYSGLQTISLYNFFFKSLYFQLRKMVSWFMKVIFLVYNSLLSKPLGYHQSKYTNTGLYFICTAV